MRLSRYIALAMALMVACSEGGVELVRQSEIGFSSYTTRSTTRTEEGTEEEETSDELDFSSFIVSAYLTDGAWAEAASGDKMLYMDNQTVYYSTTSGSWYYSPPSYWPQEEIRKLSFFAVAGLEDTPLEMTEAGDVIFTVDMDNMDNILVAKAMNKTSTSGGVQLEFNRLMTGIKITAQLAAALPNENNGSESNTYVRINSVTIKYGSLVSAATYSYNKSGLYESGDAAEVKTAISLLDGSIDMANNAEDVIEIGSAYILPNTSNKATITINYHIRTTSADGKTTTVIANAATSEIYPTQVNTLYTYNVKISLTGVSLITMSLSAWGDEPDDNAEINTDVD
ncbi:MAG: fimbrillin family protein [Rikenellaceae bacterium]